MVAAAVGAYLHVLLNVGGFLTTVACVGSSVWLLSTSPSEEVCVILSRFFFFFCFVIVIHLRFFFSCDVQKKRVTLLMASSLFQGASIGPLIDLAIQIEPRYVLCGCQWIM